MSELGKTYEIRDYKPEDKAFIMATWLRGIYYGDSWFSQVPKQIFMDNYKKFLEVLIDKGTVKIACLIEDKDVILGYSVLSKDFSVIHWVFVKSAFRNQGIGRSLVPQYPSSVSHLTKLGKELLVKFVDCVFNPFLY